MSAGGISPLIALLSSHSIDVQQDAAAALANLSETAEIRSQIASAGAIPPLVALLSSPSASVMEDAKVALRFLGVV